MKRENMPAQSSLETHESLHLKTEKSGLLEIQTRRGGRGAQKVTDPKIMIFLHVLDSQKI